MQTHERFAYLFRRYLDKTLTPEEVAEMRTYIGHPDYDEELRTLIGEGWEQDWPEQEQDPVRADSIFRAIVQADKSRRRLWPWVAAAVVLGAVVTGIGLLWQRPAPVKQVARVTTPAVPAMPVHAYLVLPDGSKVLLNEGSTLDYKNSFTAGERGVHLSGEAFFSIRKDVTRPFVVYTGSIKTVVLGTSFNVRAYPADKDVTVTVTSGKVRVQHGRWSIDMVKPNEQVTVTGLGPFKKLEVDVSLATAWKQQDLLFDDQPMPEVAHLLEQRFHVTVVLESPALAACNITAAFVKQEPLEDIVKVIARINNLAYRISGDSVLLSGQGCR
ncbi:DUF4974 domain-containing protein [Chitinophaga agrisoli]|uniref:DUF4974 domain-containing protein n=1 Tax=Chitinophaga agrisoli TaxID=2607653 RepID=A0A5B2W3N9_9BACT|nr:FecR domain-containing protein [Chitinophaga agrisoli]KAA2245468.1 DUF4974 domain-containing protein [Chitinophaga agrisoli]